MYELLTGRHPFEEDIVNVRQAQEQGAFEAAKGVRAEIPLRLSELISEMLSPDPSRRPNAFTLAGRLAVALQTADFDANFESAKRGYDDGDADTACEYFVRAIFPAPDATQLTLAYATALKLLIDSADACGRLPQYASELIQPSVKAAVSYQEGVEPYRELVQKVLAVLAVDGPSREKQGDALQTPKETLKGVTPNVRLIDGVHLVLSRIHLAVWPRREDVFLLGLDYKDAGLLSADVLGRWCVAVARRMREKEMRVSILLSSG